MYTDSSAPAAAGSKQNGGLIAREIEELGVRATALVECSDEQVESSSLEIEEDGPRTSGLCAIAMHTAARANGGSCIHGACCARESVCV
jgi:hypothetical protein